MSSTSCFSSATYASTYSGSLLLASGSTTASSDGSSYDNDSSCCSGSGYSYYSSSISSAVYPSATASSVSCATSYGGSFSPSGAAAAAAAFKRRPGSGVKKKRKATRTGDDGYSYSYGSSYTYRVSYSYSIEKVQRPVGVMQGTESTDDENPFDVAFEMPVDRPEDIAVTIENRVIYCRYKDVERHVQKNKRNKRFVNELMSRRDLPDHIQPEDLNIQACR